MNKNGLRGIIREIIHTLRYLHRSLSLSMRRRISFDYMVMYLMISTITIVVFLMGYNLVQVNHRNDMLTEHVFNLALLREKGSLSEEAYFQQIEYLGNDETTGIRIEMRPLTGNREAYKVQSDYVSDRIYNMRYIENIWLFFSSRYVKKSSSLPYTFENGDKVVYNIQLVQHFSVPSSERAVLVIAIMISQIIGITIMSIVGSYRLRRVLMPIYAMTKTAEEITIGDMEAKLDVSRAEYELKDLAQTFNEMIDRIRYDYVKQKRFVSDVSHELRTPISIVNGYARMLDRWGKKDEAILEESIDAIKSESRNMQVLVENLLTLVRSDNQTLKFEREQFRLDLMGDELVKDMIMIDEGRHTFSTDLQRPLTVCLDYAKVMQTIRIFLDNAIKYTPEGGHIELSMELVGDLVEIHVKDDGIGIDKDDLPHLFERFYRSDESRTRETGGHGLGLAIARAMVIGQKGIIRVKSKISEGSTFIITLPVSCDGMLLKDNDGDSDAID